MTFPTKAGSGGLRTDGTVNLDTMPADQLALLHLENDLLRAAQAAASARWQLARNVRAASTLEPAASSIVSERRYDREPWDPVWVKLKVAAKKMNVHPETAWRLALRHRACWPNEENGTRMVDLVKMLTLRPAADAENAARLQDLQRALQHEAVHGARDRSDT